MRRRLALRGESGTSLVELMVSMLILGVVLAATVTLAVGFERTTAQNTARQEQLDSARVASERMSRTVRTAVKPSQLTSCSVTGCAVDAFISGTGLSMSFYANFENPRNSIGPRRVSYTVATTGADAGVLIERMQVPDSPVPTATGYAYCNADAPGATAACRARVTTTRLASGVQTSGSRGVFTYYDDAGSEIPLPLGASLTSAQLARVLALELTVVVQSDSPTRPGPTTYIQRVTLPNAQAVMRLEGTGP